VFSDAFVHALFGYYSNVSTVFSGSTGSGSKRYTAEMNGVINSNGGGASFFPGDTAGTTATGGQYV